MNQYGLPPPKLQQSTTFDPACHWPEPDMSVINPNRPPAPVFSKDQWDWIFGPWSGWIKTAAMVKGAPRDYVALGLLLAASSLIGNARWASPWDGWEEPPVIWGMLVGNPSAGKSPALDAILSPLREIENALAATYSKELEKWENRSLIAKIVLDDWKRKAKKTIQDDNTPPLLPDDADAGPAPVRERVYVIDTTTEKMAELMSQTYRGLLSFRDELSGWLGNMDRYTDGGDRPFWLESFGGRPFTVDRKSTQQPIIVDRLSVAVLGGIQPDKLSALLLKSEDDGLVARFLVVSPEPVPVRRPTASLDTNILKVAFERLHGLPPSEDASGKSKPVVLGFTSEAADDLQAFRRQCQEWETEAEGLYLGHIGKLPGMAVRMACILAHLDWAAQGTASAPKELTADHVRRALNLVGGHYRLHAMRSYGFESASKEVRNVRRLAAFIQSECPTQLSVREIQRRGLSGLGDSKSIRAAFNFLAELGWCRMETETTGGHPRQFFIMNPRVWRKPELPSGRSDALTKADKSMNTNDVSGSVSLSAPVPPFPLKTPGGT